jgi:hypothetical protein
MGPRAGLETEAKEKLLCLYRGSNTGHQVCSQTLILTELPQLQQSCTAAQQYNLKQVHTCVADYLNLARTCIHEQNTC